MKIAATVPTDFEGETFDKYNVSIALSSNQGTTALNIGLLPSQETGDLTVPSHMSKAVRSMDLNVESDTDLVALGQAIQAALEAYITVKGI
jgi:hypothetical protein